MEDEKRHTTIFKVVTRRGDFGPNGEVTVDTKLRVASDVQERRKLTLRSCKRHDKAPQPINEVGVGLVLVARSILSEQKGENWGLHKENWDIPDPEDHRFMVEVRVCGIPDSFLEHQRRKR
ncbi:hypothetical protein ACFL2C_03895 [Patescibacteria group bacterium]